MVEIWPVTLPRLTGKRPRKVYVYLPEKASEAFTRESEVRYPVLYMFDGHNVFFDEEATYGKCWGMKTYMDKTEMPMIVVAVECNHSPKNGRLSEYSPFTFHDASLGRVYGRGRLTMEWLVHDLKPMIDDRYPTRPERESTMIAGSSMGGLMSLYALLAYPQFFSRAAALSPSIWTAYPRLLQLIRAFHPEEETVLYMDYGSREMENHADMLRMFVRMTQHLMESGIFVSSRIVPNGDHCEACWEEQLPFLMQTLLYTRK